MPDAAIEQTKRRVTLRSCTTNSKVACPRLAQNARAGPIPLPEAACDPCRDEEPSMTSKTWCMRLSVVAMTIALLMPSIVSGQVTTPPPATRQIVFMSTDAIIDPLQTVHTRAEQAIGRSVRMHWGSARGDLKKAILAGEYFDVALLLPDVNAELLRANKILPESYEIAQVKTAIGQRGTGPLVDVSTPAALKRAILGAKALRWFETGVALATVNKVLDTL